jgi:hypothetical protein
VSDRTSIPADVQSSRVLDPGQKFWLDYISKLADRSAQAHKDSGATNWVLIGVAAAILYRTFERIPEVLSAWNAAYLIFMLELNVVLCVAGLLASLGSYVVKETEKRLLPKSVGNLQRVATIAITGIEFLVGVLQLSLARSIQHAPWIRWTLAIFGLFYVSNAIYAVVRGFRRYRSAKKLGIPYPQFRSGQLAYPVALMLVFGALLIVSILGMGHYFMGFSSAIAALTPLGAATYSLVFLGIMAVLFARMMNAASMQAYSSLEQAILLENLSVTEIRNRFVEELLGSGVKEWLQGLVSSIDREQATLAIELQGVKGRMQELGVSGPIPKDVQRELIMKVVTAVKERQAALHRYTLQMEAFINSGLSESDRRLLELIKDDLHQKVDRIKEGASDSLKLVDQIKSMNVALRAEGGANGPLRN